MKNEETEKKNKIIFIEYKRANIFERISHNIARIVRNIFKTKES